MSIIDKLNPPIGDISTMLEVDASKLLEEENVDWRFCVGHAKFHHRDGGTCEFILHIGHLCDAPPDAYWSRMLDEMEAFGCSRAFQALYKHAVEMGVQHLLLYA